MFIYLLESGVYREIRRGKYSDNTSVGSSAKTRQLFWIIFGMEKRNRNHVIIGVRHTTVKVTMFIYLLESGVYWEIRRGKYSDNTSVGSSAKTRQLFWIIFGMEKRNRNHEHPDKFEKIRSPVYT